MLFSSYLWTPSYQGRLTNMFMFKLICTLVIDVNGVRWCTRGTSNRLEKGAFSFSLFF